MVLVAVCEEGILAVQFFFKAVGNVGKACGHLIFGNLTYPIAFACIMPSMIGPVMLVTSNTFGKTVHCKLQFVPGVGLKFLVIPDQRVLEPCGLVGCCSQLLCQLHSQSGR